MTKANFIKAIEILSNTHTVDIRINHVEPNALVHNVLKEPTIHIKKCNASAIEQLRGKGFNVSMSGKGLEVLDYNVK